MPRKSNQPAACESSSEERNAGSALLLAIAVFNEGRNNAQQSKPGSTRVGHLNPGIAGLGNPGRTRFEHGHDLNPKSGGKVHFNMASTCPWRVGGLSGVG